MTDLMMIAKSSHKNSDMHTPLLIDTVWYQVPPEHMINYENIYWSKMAFAVHFTSLLDMRQ